MTSSPEADVVGAMIQASITECLFARRGSRRQREAQTWIFGEPIFPGDDDWPADRPIDHVGITFEDACLAVRLDPGAVRDLVRSTLASKREPAGSPRGAGCGVST